MSWRERYGSGGYGGRSPRDRYDNRDRDRDRGGRDRGYGGRSSYRGRTERHPLYNPSERGPGRPGGIDEGGGALKLARIHGTELDRINCPYYYKVGACRHGDKCSRRHNKPKFSQTLLVKHMWLNPQVQFLNLPESQKPKEHEMREFNERVQENFNAFYEEIFQEAAKYGYLECIHVSENLGDHMVGNVYLKYEDESDATTAMEKIQGRFYHGQPLSVEFSPVTDFSKARCRQYDDGVCRFGGFCNYVHIRQPHKRLVRELFENQVKPEESSSDSSSSEEDDEDSKQRKKKKKKKSSSRRRSRSRSRSRDRRSRRTETASAASAIAPAEAPADPTVAAALAAARQ